MIALIDCNNFYTSRERLSKLNLNVKPVVVLSNNGGSVNARSNEAKALGIPMDAPAFEYNQLFEQHNVNDFSSNYELYRELRNCVMKILSDYST